MIIKFPICPLNFLDENTGLIGKLGGTAVLLSVLQRHASIAEVVEQACLALGNISNNGTKQCYVIHYTVFVIINNVRS